ncbi:MAG: AMP-binding protein, partial [Ideonella sp.]|nr:AMP-binding protein [Ideonella sp.]
ENIYPSEVESVLAAHPAVQDVAVVGLPDATWGVPVDEATLIDWCRDRMAGFKRPKRVRFVPEGEMPRTATGKLQHRVLRERLARETEVAGGA